MVNITPVRLPDARNEETTRTPNSLVIGAIRNFARSSCVYDNPGPNLDTQVQGYDRHHSF